MLNLKPAKSSDFFWHVCFQTLIESNEKYADFKNAYGKEADPVNRLHELMDKEFCIYIIGPMSQRPYYNIAKFYEAKHKLESYGVKVVTPHDIIDADTDWLSAVIKSLRALNEATVVCRLESECGVEESIGTGIENLACIGAEIPVFKLDVLIDFMDVCCAERDDRIDYL